MHLATPIRRRSAPAHAPRQPPIPIRAAPPRAQPLRKAGCSCGGGCPSCMAREITGPDHPAEREADAVAARVISMTGADTIASVQRMEETLPIASLNSVPPLHLKCSDNTQVSAGAPERAAAAVTGGGRPLSAEESAYFEPRFSRDFSAVRIHDNGPANDAARAINARAYTLGQNIAFAPNQYISGSQAGRRLMAHELTHTIQQAHTPHALQREPGAPEKMPETSTKIRAANPAERREFAEMATKFLRGQREHFLYLVNSDLNKMLEMMKQAAQGGLRAIKGIDGTDDLAEKLRTEYLDSVRILITSRTKKSADPDTPPPTVLELYERHRDAILAFALLKHKADPGAGELTAELNRPLPGRASADERARHKAINAARRNLRVVTSTLTNDITRYFDTKAGKMTVPLPANTVARFAGNIPKKLQRGLQSLAADLHGALLSTNTTALLALELSRFGGGYHLYRFTRLDLGTSLGTELLVEREGEIGVEGLNQEQRTQMRKRFNNFGFQSSGFNTADFDEVLIGLSEVPDGQLTSLGALKFQRSDTDPTTPKAGGDYSQTTHTIRLFNAAYSGGLVRLGSGVRPLSFAAASIVHEIGHALDLSTLRTTAIDTEAAQDALLAKFGTGGGGYDIPHRRDPRRQQYDALRGPLDTAQAAENAARSRSGARWTGGNVVDGKSLKPEFRAAAVRDGARVPTPKSLTGRGFPTTYPDPDSFWQEYFAESFSLFQTAPDLLQRMRPNVFAFMQAAFP